MPIKNNSTVPQALVRLRDMTVLLMVAAAIVVSEIQLLVRFMVPGS